jgi:hypothetical protein
MIRQDQYITSETETRHFQAVHRAYQWLYLSTYLMSYLVARPAGKVSNVHNFPSIHVGRREEEQIDTTVQLALFDRCDDAEGTSDKFSASRQQSLQQHRIGVDFQAGAALRNDKFGGLERCDARSRRRQAAYFPAEVTRCGM